MSKSSKRRVAALFSVALSAGAVLGFAPPASAAGNSPNAGLCQKGGWETLVRADQSSFKNQGECVAYAAQGGTPSPKSAAQVLCESFGGTFGQTEYPGVDAEILWSCDNWTWTTGPEYGVKVNALVNQCFYGEGPQGSTAFTQGTSPANVWCVDPRD